MGSGTKRNRASWERAVRLAQWFRLGNRCLAFLRWRAHHNFNRIRWYVNEKFEEAILDHGAADRAQLVDEWSVTSAEQLEYEAFEYEELALERGWITLP